MQIRHFDWSIEYDSQKYLASSKFISSGLFIFLNILVNYFENIKQRNPFYKSKVYNLKKQSTMLPFGPNRDQTFENCWKDLPFGFKFLFIFILGYNAVSMILSFLFTKIVF
jgi:hypothetical protein